MYFLVIGTIEYSSYMNERGNSIFTDTRLVIADDENNARDKFKAYWENQSSEYSHTYACKNIIVNETIE